MRILVDTSVWSLALRRNISTPHPAVSELAELIREGRVAMTGVVRQELLSGVRTAPAFAQLRDRLRAFPDIPPRTDDYERAAEYFNACRAAGVQGSNTDFLLCALSERHGFPILTTDRDFESFARALPIALHRPRSA